MNYAHRCLSSFRPWKQLCSESKENSISHHNINSNKTRQNSVLGKIGKKLGIRVPKYLGKFCKLEKNSMFYTFKSHLPKKPWKLRETSKFCLSVCRHLIIIEGRSINPQASRIINSLLDLFGNDQFVLEKTAKSHWCFRSWLKKWKST